MGLALACAGVIGACGGEPTEPVAPGPTPPSGAGETPTEPARPSVSPLVGTWRGVVTAFLPTIQTVTWRFGADGVCLQSFLTIDNGVEFTSDRPCTWVADRSTVTVTYAGAAGPVTFTMDYSFPAEDALRLGQDEFSRVG
ncbi:MAG TPA: hypothetical protein VFK09_02885 [Gemmatimonadales bacterium]|nr:hypothetical protein [Gemmatimonadales bacterium]